MDMAENLPSTVDTSIVPMSETVLLKTIFWSVFLVIVTAVTPALSLMFCENTLHGTIPMTSIKAVEKSVEIFSFICLQIK